MAFPSSLRGAVATALLTVLAATGCGSAEDDPASGFAGSLEAMAGVADARVEREAFDTDHHGEEVVVDMDVDATAEEVSAVLDAFLDRRRETDGEPQDARVTVGASTTDTEGDDLSPSGPSQAVPGVDGAENERIARLLVAAVAAFPSDAVTVTADEWSVVSAADGTSLTSRVDEMVDAVRADERLASAPGLGLTAVAGAENDRRTVAIDAYEGLTRELVASWQQISSGLDPALVRAVWLGPASIHLEVQVDEDVPPRELTTEAYGDVLWPTLRAALDTLVAMPRSATLTAVNRHEVDATDGSHSEDRFLVTRPALRTGRDRLGRTWHAEAAAYLDRALVRGGG